MRTDELKRQLTSIRFATYSYGLRHEGKVVCESQISAKRFAINFLVDLAVSGVNFSDSELTDIYLEIYNLVSEKDEISTDEIPYAQAKKRPPVSHTLTIMGEIVSYK